MKDGCLSHEPCASVKGEELVLDLMYGGKQHRCNSSALRLTVGSTNIKLV